VHECVKFNRINDMKNIHTTAAAALRKMAEYDWASDPKWLHERGGLTPEEAEAVAASIRDIDRQHYPGKDAQWHSEFYQPSAAKPQPTSMARQQINGLAGGSALNLAGGAALSEALKAYRKNKQLIDTQRQRGVQQSAGKTQPAAQDLNSVYVPYGK